MDIPIYSRNIFIMIVAVCRISACSFCAFPEIGSNVMMYQTIDHCWQPLFISKYAPHFREFQICG